MLSGPGELLSLVLLRVLTMSSVLKVSAELPGFSEDLDSSSWVILSNKIGNRFKKLKGDKVQLKTFGQQCRSPDRVLVVHERSSAM